MKKTIITITIAIIFLALQSQKMAFARWAEYGNVENHHPQAQQEHRCGHHGSQKMERGMFSNMSCCKTTSAKDIAEYRKYLAETKESRKKLHDLKFEYHEAMWNPETTLGDLEKMREEMGKLQEEIDQKQPGGQPEQ